MILLCNVSGFSAIRSFFVFVFLTPLHRVTGFFHLSCLNTFCVILAYFCLV